MAGSIFFMFENILILSFFIPTNMKNIVLLLGLCYSLSGVAQTPVHLKGKLVDMGATLVNLSYDGATSVIGKEGSFMIRTDQEGCFDTLLTVPKPGFYRISRNTLYLSPGDDMEVYITPSNKEAVFKGKGAEMNTYMKGRLFPKGGSFLGELRGKKGEFEEIKGMVDSLARLRMAELEQVGEATPEFRDLEKARIIADVANSYMTYPSYCSIKEIRGKEEYDRFIQKITPELMEQIPLVNEERYLDVAVVRDVINRAMETPSLAGQLQFPLRTQELFKSGEYAYRLDSEVNPLVIKEVEEYVKMLKNKDVKTVLQAKLASVGSLLKGSPAIDLELTTPEGKTAHLSDFRGKVIYVDLWATWCGPCIAESPKFHELSEKYKGDNIVFLAISTDTNRKAWLNFIQKKESSIPEFNCTDTKNLNAGWQIKYIPRFLLIDEDFKILEAYAPRPSQPEAVELLDKVLKK